MEATVRIQKISVDHRRKFSHPTDKKHRTSRSSVSVSHIEKRQLACRQQSFPIQHFIIRDEQSKDIIHTIIGTSRETTNLLTKKLSIQNIHLQATSSQLSLSYQQHQTEKAVKLVKNKIKPAQVIRISRPGQSVGKLFNDPFTVDSCHADPQKPDNSLLANKNQDSPITITENQHLNVATIDSNGSDADSNIIDQKIRSVPYARTSVEKSTGKSTQQKLIYRRRRCRRSFLCASLTLLVAFLLIGSIAALLVAFVKPKSPTSLETIGPDIMSTNGTVTASTNTSITASTSANTITTFTTTITSSMTAVTTATALSMTTSMISTATTTASTTSASTTTDATTSATSTTASTTTTTATTETTTATTTTSTTSATLINPCLSGIYWNTTGVTYAGNGTAGNSLSQLSSPSGIFINPNDTSYISDSGNCRVVSYLRNAISGALVAGTVCSGTSLNRFSGGIRYDYVDAGGNIYVVDTNNDRVMRWASGASVGAVVAGNGTTGMLLNQLDYPYGIWVDSSSNVYVTEYNNQRVTKWFPGALTSVVVAGITNVSGSTTDKLSSPTGLFYDETNQNLYIANSAAHTISKWRVGDSNGTIVAGTAGSAGSTATRINFPTGITVDQWQNIYVNDRSNDRIQLFCNGNLSAITIAGRGAGGSNFSTPFDVKLDSQLNLYVVDNGAHRVMKFFKL